jgi:hypothetical protein
MYTENEIYQYSEYMDWCRNKIRMEYKDLCYFLRNLDIDIEIDNVDKVPFDKTRWDIHYTIIKWALDTKTKKRKKMGREWGTILLNSYETWLNEKKVILRNERIDKLLNEKNL